jgi:uncharacterized membrane protein
VDDTGPGEAWSYFVDRLPDTLAWMGLDLALAVVPLVLAALLFRSQLLRRSRGRQVPWWIGFAAYVAFLPNAAYVWAGYLWFFGQIRSAWVLDGWRIPLLVPLYLVYFGVGSACFVVCMHWTRAYFAARWSHSRVQLLTVALCAATAIGIYLGRADFNSWSLVSDLPGVVAALHRWPSHATAMARTALAFVATLVLVVTVEGVVRRRRAKGRARSIDGLGQLAEAG